MKNVFLFMILVSILCSCSRKETDWGGLGVITLCFQKKPLNLMLLEIQL